ncbi:MAG TPA: hypothetical protein VIV11_08270 [Kofleriaceae bacterium]
MRVCALALVLSACGDDISLRVAVEHPSDVTVALTKVTIYESASLTCIDVAFSRFGPDELEAFAVTEQTVAADGEVTGALEGISRVDHKVIVARGYAESGAWITAGCEEHDVVEEATRIVITTVPTVDAATVLDIDLGDPLLAVLATTDATGKAVGGRRVAWNVYGPAGSEPMSAMNVAATGDGEWAPTKAVCTASNGAAELHPPPPNVIGGYAVQLRAEWALDLPALYSRFNADFGFRGIVPPTGSSRYCAVRVKGTTTRIVCLDNGFARDFDVVVNGGVVGLVERGSMMLGAGALAVVSVPSGADRDVYMMSTTGVLVPLFGAPMADNSAVPCPTSACTVEDVMPVPPCASTAGKLLVRVRTNTGAAELKQMNARGGGTQPFPTPPLTGRQLQLDNAGCVTRADPAGGAPTLRQVVTYHLGSRVAVNEFVAEVTRASYNCNATSCMGNELFPGAGVGFTTGSEPRLVATFVDATGVVVTELVMAPSDIPNRDLFVERSRTPSAGIPDRMVVGQYDDDGELDLMWNIAAKRGTTFEIAYARKVGAQRLEALSRAVPFVVSALDTADLTGDGADDVMIIGDMAGSTTMQGLAVIPMNAAAMVQQIKPDDTCAQ